MKPQRIQLRRTKGWRLPPNTVKVDRTTRYGNPYVVRPTSQQSGFYSCSNAKDAVNCFSWEARQVMRLDTVMQTAKGEIGRADILALRGKNLACWCPLQPDTPCHADVLIELANKEEQ